MGILQNAALLRARQNKQLLEFYSNSDFNHLEYFDDDLSMKLNYIEGFKFAQFLYETYLREELKKLDLQYTENESFLNTNPIRRFVDIDFIFNKVFTAPGNRYTYLAPERKTLKCYSFQEGFVRYLKTIHLIYNKWGEILGSNFTFKPISLEIIQDLLAPLSYKNEKKMLRFIQTILPRLGLTKTKTQKTHSLEEKQKHFNEKHLKILKEKVDIYVGEVYPDAYLNCGIAFAKYHFENALNKELRSRNPDLYIEIDLHFLFKDIFSKDKTLRDGFPECIYENELFRKGFDFFFSHCLPIYHEYMEMMGYKNIPSLTFKDIFKNKLKYLTFKIFCFLVSKSSIKPDFYTIPYLNSEAYMILENGIETIVFRDGRTRVLSPKNGQLMQLGSIGFFKDRSNRILEEWLKNSVEVKKETTCDKKIKSSTIFEKNRDELKQSFLTTLYDKDTYGTYTSREDKNEDEIHTFQVYKHKNKPSKSLSQDKLDQLAAYKQKRYDSFLAKPFICGFHKLTEPYFKGRNLANIMLAKRMIEAGYDRLVIKEVTDIDGYNIKQLNIEEEKIRSYFFNTCCGQDLKEKNYDLQNLFLIKYLKVLELPNEEIINLLNAPQIVLSDIDYFINDALLLRYKCKSAPDIYNSLLN